MRQNTRPEAIANRNQEVYRSTEEEKAGKPDTWIQH